MIKFSIIIPVRTINDFLRESIPHLKNLDYKNFEVIIVVDFESEYDFDGDERFKIILAPEDRRSPGNKRNLGAEKSTGDILAFLDDDAYPKKDWLSKAAKIFEEDADIYALGAPAMTPEDVSIFERASGRILESYLASGFTQHRHIPSKRHTVGDYPTVNLFIKRDIFERIGGFDLNVWPGEDTKICLDLINHAGREFLYDPEPQVYHHRRNIFLPHLQQISRYGRHRGYFAKIFPKTSLRPSYFIPSLFILGVLFGYLICKFVPQLWILYYSVILLYAVLLTTEGIRASRRDKTLSMFFLFCFGTLLTHVFYGSNFILGLLKEPKLELRKIDEKTGNYLGG